MSSPKMILKTLRGSVRNGSWFPFTDADGFASSDDISLVSDLTVIIIGKMNEYLVLEMGLWPQ